MHRDTTGKCEKLGQKFVKILSIMELRFENFIKLFRHKLKPLGSDFQTAPGYETKRVSEGGGGGRE